jgi:hypothetical protein
MKKTPATTRAFALATAILLSGFADAHHDGGWHPGGSGSPQTVTFCGQVWLVFGAGAAELCVSLSE